MTCFVYAAVRSVCGCVVYRVMVMAYVTLLFVDEKTCSVCAAVRSVYAIVRRVSLLHYISQRRIPCIETYSDGTSNMDACVYIY